MKDIIKLGILKVLSGRYLLTITSAIIFLLLIIKNMIEGKDAMVLIAMVFTLYFSKQRNETKQ